MLLILISSLLLRKEYNSKDKKLSRDFNTIKGKLQPEIPDFPDQNQDEFDNEGFSMKSKKKSKQIKPKKPKDDDLVDDFGEDNKKQFPNSVIGTDGKRICLDGYVSDSIIDSRGCWRCDAICQENSICEYPGVCVVPVPEIKGIKIIKKGNKTSGPLISITYSVLRNKFSPSAAYCQFEGQVIQSSSVNGREILCQMPSQTTSVSISFDSESWSSMYTNISVSKLKVLTSSPKWINIIGVSFLAIGVVLIPVIYFKNRNTAPKQYKETRPMAYFPMVDEKANENQKKPIHY